METTKLEKIKKLNNALSVLKQEFVGLDDIIDELGKSITSWYVTPEVIRRPVIVSLWGMTGTGKTSVVNRLIELLGLSNKSLTFDCGSEATDGGSYRSSFTERLEEVFNLDDSEGNIDSVSSDLVFILDEFQHARTISEDGSEVNKSNFRPVWSLIDSGIIESSCYCWELGSLVNYVDDLSSFAATNPGVPVKDGWVVDKEWATRIYETGIGYFYFSGQFTENPTNKTDEDIKGKPVEILCSKYARLILRHIPNGIQRIKECTTLDDCISLLEELRDIIIVPKRFNCSKSLIFIIGNLDEAFQVGGEINPDLDADIFYDRTSKVTISDIKYNLKRRFRAEQIARFGNNIIKYPSLKKEHFKEVISREVTRVCSEFEASNGIKITCDNSFLNLLYSESVYPVQGVRPVFTSIVSQFTPLLSDIILNIDDSIKDVVVSVKEDDLRIPVATAVISTKDGKELYSKKIKLTLGELRDPSTKKTRYINAVHEAGHAIAMAYLTGKAPLSLVAVSSVGGGFCVTYDSEQEGEIRSKLRIDNDVIIALSGYNAEHQFFDDNLTLMGSGNDLKDAWDTFSTAVYETGYYTPVKYSNLQTTNGGYIPAGISDEDEIQDFIKSKMKKFDDESKEIIKENTDLLVKIALQLGKEGSLTQNQFLEFIQNNNTGTLTVEKMEESRKKNSSDYYKNYLESLVEK